VSQTIKEKADAEAARAEAEDPDEEQVETPEAEPEEEPEEEPVEPTEPGEQTARQARSQDPQKAFDRAARAFEDKLKAIFEVDELTAAPYPGVVGFMLPGYIEPKTNENYTRCQTCNGRGKVLTGAVTGDDSKDWHVCPDGRCKGQGYWTKRQATEPAPATGPLAVGTPPEGNGEFAEAPTWLGDPNLTPAA